MSAPWEVWQTIIDGDDGNPFIVDGNTYKRLDGDVRYLRSDLRCGDCEKWHTDMVRSAEGYLQHLPGCETYPCRFIDDPACMEIVPKENQP